MDDSEYAIYEACSPMPTTHGTDVHKMGTVPNNFQIPPSPVISSVYISTSQNSQSLSPKNTFPISNLAKESIPPLSNSESIDSSKPSCISYINILPSNFLQNPVYSLQDEAIFEENKSRTEGVNTVVLPNSYGAVDNSTFRLLLTPLQYSNLVKNNSSDKVVTQTLLLHSNLTSDDSSSTLAEEITNISDENLPNENPCSLPVNSSGNAKEKKGQAQSQVIIKPLQDELSFDIVENISQNLDNSHIFEIIENEKECDINKLSQTKDVDGDLSPGTFRFLLSPPINENERIVQSGDDIEDINTTFNIIYNCTLCNKFFSSEDLSIQHKKECVPSSYLNGSHLKRPLLNNEDIFSEFSQGNNLNNDKDRCKLAPKSNIFWICLVCSQECGSTCILRSHYESHSIEELASALLKCTTPCNVRNEKLISDQSTMTESLSNGSPKDGENSVSGLISNITVKENNYLENAKEDPVDLDTLSETVTVNNSKIISTSLYTDTSLPEVKNKVPTKVNKKNKHNSKYKKKSKTSDTGLKSRDPHSCPICKKFLSSRGNLSKHLIQHQAVKPWVCKVCGLGFNSKRNHDHHYLQRHTTLRPNVCNICGKGYTNKRTLSEHMIFHRKEKEFECQLCRKSFLTKKCLNRHMQRHETNRKFVCKLCHKTFRVNVDLASHLKLVHSSDKKKKSKINSKSANNIAPNRVVFNTNLPNIAETLKKNQHCPKTISQPTPLVTDHNHLSMTSNAEQLNKLKDFSDLLQSNSNSLLPDISHELQSPTLRDARETLFISGDSIDAQAVIPVTSTTDDLIYNNSYGFSLQNRTAILSQDLSSPSIYVMTGGSVAQNDNHTNSLKNSTVWHPGTELRTYQDSTIKEVPTNNSSGTEIHLFPGVLENITRSYSDGLEQGESLKFEVAPNTTTSEFQKIPRRNEATRNTCDKTFDSDLGENLVSEKSAVDALPNDNQTQSLNLDLLSQTLQLDFQPSHEHSGAAFI